MVFFVCVYKRYLNPEILAICICTIQSYLTIVGGLLLHFLLKYIDVNKVCALDM